MRVNKKREQAHDADLRDLWGKVAPSARYAALKALVTADPWG